MQQVATGSGKRRRADHPPGPPAAASPPSFPRSLRRLRSRKSKFPVPLPLLVGVAGALAFAAVSAGGTRRDIPLPSVEEVAIEAGFGLDQVAVSGHRHTADADIFDAIDLPNVRTQLRLDTRAIKARIERLPWIARAEVTRLLPGGLEIRVVERAPAAVWLVDGGEQLVDATGRVLGRQDAGGHPTLPRMSGLAAPEAVAELLDLIGRNPELRTRMISAERVSGRRWTLHLVGGTRVALPAADPVRALQQAFAVMPSGEPAARPGAVIDLRVPGRAIVGPG